MLIRAATAFALVLMLAACGGEKEEPACCAIAPKAKCDSALHGLGVTQDEQRALFDGARCPTDTLSVERIRELDSQWPQACREAGMMSPQLSLDRPACRPPDLETLTPPTGVDATAWAACGTNLTARGLKENELWVMMHDTSGICPNAFPPACRGAGDAMWTRFLPHMIRIREIIANDWDAASCTHATKEQMLKALDTGACGGDAG